MIEAYTYRMGAHTTSDDPTKYRLADELRALAAARTRSSGSRPTSPATAAADDGFFAEVEAEADASWPPGCGRAASTLPDPHLLEIFDQVYAEQTPDLAEQQDGVRRLPRPASRTRRAVAEGVGMTKMTLAKALNAGLRRGLEADPKVLVMAARTSASSAASSGSPTACRRTSASTG